MAIFVGVSKKPGLILKIRPGEDSYWCVYGGTQLAKASDNKATKGTSDPQAHECG